LSRQLLAALAALAVVVAVIVLWPEGSDERDVADLSVEDLANLDLGARELVSLAVRGKNQDFHARYAGTDGRQIEVWVLAGDVRQVVEGDDIVATLSQERGGESTRCTDEGDGWTCEPVTGESVAANDLGLQDAVEQFTADLVGITVDTSDDEIASVPVRCFRFTTDEVPAEICLSLDGVVARLVAGEDSLELIELDDEVDEGDFALPA